jgi:asparagine synthase (glutamine-hydrolysing)
MTDLLRHRGPDNRSTFQSATGTIGFGHTRLSLLDPTARGNQPFHDNRYFLVFNGEIYNFQELRRELEAVHGFDFRTGTDTEVVFRLLQVKSISEALSHLQGMFSLAFYDSGTNTLTLARDRLGIKPLFYTVRAGRVTFASELKSLLVGAKAFSPLELNQIAILEGSFGYLERSRSVTGFRGVYQLEPGSYLQFKDSLNASSGYYFRTASLLDEQLYRELDRAREPEVVERFSALLRASVSRMLIADASIGAFVSGGVDSSVISLVSRQCGKNPALYSVNVVGRHSEIEAARELARSLNTNLYEYAFQPEDFLREWVAATYAYEAPIIMNPHAVPFAHIAKIARDQGEKAVLTGEGADELLLGYSPHIRQRYLPGFTGLTSLVDALLGRFGLRQLVSTQSPFALQSDELRELALGNESYQRKFEYSEATAFIKDESQRTLQKISLRLLDTTLQALLWRNDRMGMMYSVESRFPFLDEDFLRFAISLPVKYKVRYSLTTLDRSHPFLIGKYILRRAYESQLSTALAHRKKQPFPIHGLTDVVVKFDFFKDGFWQYLLDQDRRKFLTQLSATSQLVLQRMASVELWGRLYAFGQRPEEVQNQVHEHIRMRIK